MIDAELRTALDTLRAEQRQAITAGTDTEAVFQELTARVSVLAALAKNTCPGLTAARPAGEPAVFSEAQWAALFGHVDGCVVCRPKDPRRLREQVVWSAPGMLGQPEDDDRKRFGWFNSPRADQGLLRPFTRVAQAAQEAWANLGPVLANYPQLVRGVVGGVVLLITGLLTLGSSAPVPSLPEALAEGLPPTSVPATTTAGTDPPATSTVPPSPGATPTDPNQPKEPGKPGEPGGGPGQAVAARYNIGVPAPSTAPCVDDANRLPARPADPPPGQITVDARPLSVRGFVIHGKTGWNPSRSVQTFQLAPGSYGFQIAAPIAFWFTVTQAGLIDYPDGLAGVSGKGTRVLSVSGVAVTLDARRLAPGATVLLSNASVTNEDWITCKRIRLVPAPHYQIQQGSGQVAAMQFRVTPDGRISYDSTLDTASGGFLRGNGSGVLEFRGFLVHVDARRAGGVGLRVQFAGGIPFSYTREQTLYLLPTSPYYLQVEGGKLTGARFTLGAKGSITIEDSLREYLALDRQDGVPVVTVLRGPLP